MRHTGYTLIELIVVTAVLGVLLTIALPPTVRWRDGVAVRAARDELAAGLSWTRWAAAAHGGASLVLDPAQGRFWTRAAGRDWHGVDLTGRYGVRIDPGPGGLMVFHYDGLGLGRFGNHTVRIRRGHSEAGITVSSYGRFRRW